VRHEGHLPSPLTHVPTPHALAERPGTARLPDAPGELHPLAAGIGDDRASAALGLPRGRNCLTAHSRKRPEGVVEQLVLRLGNSISRFGESRYNRAADTGQKSLWNSTAVLLMWNRRQSPELFDNRIARR
jgi:hypothetical protein